jgi:PTH1 family peptidyl-tRNA hydrolase
VVERLADRLGGGRFRPRFAGRLLEARGPAGPVVLLIPETYMNASGDSVGPAAGSLHAPPGAVLVVHDEIDLPFGAVRGKQGGGHGGHNGLRSVHRGLGSGDYARIRLGVGRPSPAFRGDEADWVLTAFTEPADEVEALIDRGVAMAESALSDGMAGAIARFHASPAGHRARERAGRRAAGEPPAPA